MAPPTERRSPIGFRCIVVPLKLIREIPMRAITHPMKNAGRSFPSSFKKMRAVIAVNTGAIETITPTFDACE